MRTSIILTLVGLLVLAAGLTFSAWNRGTPVEAVAIARQSIEEYVDEEGKTRLADTYLITMPYDGRIEPITLIEGAPIEKDQVVAQIAPIDIELTTAAAKAVVDRLKASIKENDDVSVESTALTQTVSMVESIDRMVEAAAARVKAGQARLDYAEKNLARMERLNKTGAKTEDEVDQAQVNQVESGVNFQQDNLVLRAAEATRTATSLMPTMVRQYIQRKALTHAVLEQQLAEAEIRMREAEKNARLGKLTSPVQGVVLERAVSDARQVAAGTVLLRVGRWEDLEIEADVLSQDVVRVKPGQKVEIHGPAIGPEPAVAEVTRIYPAGFTKTSSLGVEQQRVKVIMKLRPQDLERLRSQNDLGVAYRVRVRIFTAQASDALVVPRSSLFRGPKNDWRVYVVRDGRAHLQAVQVGLSNDDAAQVTKGLEPGELVIVAPETNLAEGQAVRVIDTE